jgi:glucose-6-phosphate isomerase
MVEDNVTAGDFLHGFYLGTRQALAEKDRESLTITVRDVSAQTVGKLIALFERAVGFYASLININAYHQPGVEAGKKAAEKVIEIQRKILSFISSNPSKLFTVNEISQQIECEDDMETVAKVIQHLTSNPTRSVVKSQERSFLDAKYGLK